MRYFVFLMLLLTVVSSCGTGKSLPSEYFLLSGIERTDKIEHTSLEHAVLGVLSVNIPAYLDRPQLVKRQNNSELTMFEYQRWAGNLRSEIQRVIAQNIAYYSNAKAVVEQPWNSALNIDYQIQVNIRQFEANTNKNFSYDIQWLVFSTEKRKLVATNRLNGQKNLNTDDMQAMVFAQNQVLAEAAKQITTHIIALNK